MAILASAQAAEHLLAAMSDMIGALQARVDARGVQAIKDGTMDDALARGLWFQKAAYAGIIMELRQRVEKGRRVEQMQIDDETRQRGYQS